MEIQRTNDCYVCKQTAIRRSRIPMLRNAWSARDPAGRLIGCGACDAGP
jgi:hypothetical protein